MAGLILPDVKRACLHLSWSGGRGWQRIPLSGLAGEGGSALSEDTSLHLKLIPSPADAGEALRMDLVLRSARPFRVQGCRLEWPLKEGADADPVQAVFCNGWQSWSESRWFRTRERIAPLLRVAHPWLAPYGDTLPLREALRRVQYPARPGQRGLLPSWSWTLLRSEREGRHRSLGPEDGAAQQASTITGLGSLDEEQAYTLFLWDERSGALSLLRDAPSAWPSAAGERCLFSLLLYRGSEAGFYRHWMRAQSVRAMPAPPTRGYTSWYRHYTRISEPVLLSDLATLDPSRETWFQVDDGWQTRIGDWTPNPERFPKGMKALADEVRQRGLRPGLWLAPFVAERRSQLLQRHPEWVERDLQGRPLKAGYSPLWSGSFYALNPDHPGLRQHLSEVLERVRDDWGFALLKLDFLYAAGLAHSPDSTRAARMRSAMRFLREAAGSAAILACGVPMPAAFGLVEYCRIGADVHLAWEHRLLAWLRNRERVSTRIALASNLGRRLLDGLAFGNDPDVFLLRQGDAALRLSPEACQTLWLVNSLFGRLLFCSDRSSEYGPEHAALMRAPWMDAMPCWHVLVEEQPDSTRPGDLRLAGLFSLPGHPLRYAVLINLSDSAWSTSAEQALGAVCGPQGRDAVVLRPHQSLWFEVRES